jgi:hypothetical protein
MPRKAKEKAPTVDAAEANKQHDDGLNRQHTNTTSGNKSKAQSAPAKEAWEQALPFPIAADTNKLKAIVAAACLCATQLEAALVYTNQGVPVIPCNWRSEKRPDGTVKINKCPRIKAGVYGATTDPEQIRSWWKQWPNALIGVPGGRRTGIWFLDVDSKEAHGADGLDAWTKLEIEHGEATTRTHLTGTNGRHLIYLWDANRPVGCVTGNLPKGMEVKGEGGYVIFPPSPYQLGDQMVGYSVTNDDYPAAAPEWLCDLILSVPEQSEGSGGEAERRHPRVMTIKRAKGYLKKACEEIRNAQPGELNNTVIERCYIPGRAVGGELLTERKAWDDGLLKAIEANPHHDPKMIERGRASYEAGKLKPLELATRAEQPDINVADFKMDEEGLWYSPGLDRHRVSQSFEILGRCRTAPDVTGRANEWGLLIRYSDADGRSRDEIIPASNLHSDIAALCADLAARGMDIETSERAHGWFRKYLSAVTDISARVTTTHAYGWNTIGGQRAFVLPSAPISAGELSERVLTAAGISNMVESRGNLGEWKAAVAQLVGQHTLGVLMTSAAFAGPLLDVGAFESGGLHIYGPSSTGKTTLLRAAATVWGKGSLENGYVRTWRATDNALEAVLAGAE